MLKNFTHEAKNSTKIFSFIYIGKLKGIKIKEEVTNVGRLLTTFHGIQKILPVHMGIDKIIEMINHRTVKANDIRSIHLVDNVDSNKVDYVIMFKKVETHRLLLDICRVNQSNLDTYFLVDNEEIKVSVPNVLKMMRKEVITKMREAQKPFWNVRIFHRSNWTVRTVAKMVENAINYYNKSTTSTNEIAYISCNPHCAYVGFHDHEQRQIVMMYLRDVFKLGDYRVVAEQAEIKEFEPDELQRARQSALIEDTSTTKISTTTNGAHNTPPEKVATTNEVHTHNKNQHEIKDVLVKRKDKASEKERKNAKKFVKYFNKVMKEKKFGITVVTTDEETPTSKGETKEHPKGENLDHDDNIINIDTDEDFSD